MIAAGNRIICDAGQTVVFGDKNFEVVNESGYLGALGYQGTMWVSRCNEESKLQIGAFTACKSICSHLTWHIKKKLTIYKTLIYAMKRG
jgi:hypothetical protein